MTNGQRATSDDESVARNDDKSAYKVSGGEKVFCNDFVDFPNVRRRVMPQRVLIKLAMGLYIEEADQALRLCYHHVHGATYWREEGGRTWQRQEPPATTKNILLLMDEDDHNIP